MPAKISKSQVERNIKLTIGSVRNIKLTLEYDGADFFGFQRQPNHPTVQQAIETALSSLFQTKIQISAASSRTDAGVHAEEQIVNFKTTSELTVHRISVLKAEDVSADFHSRFHASSKIYEYRVWNYPLRPALSRNHAHHEPLKLNLAMMRSAAKSLIGKHDFRAFTSEEKIVKSSSVARKKISFVRTLQKLSVQKQDKMIVFTVQADGFLYHMVRNLVGTLVAVGKGKLKAEAVPKILKSRDRKLAAATMPAHGLCLKKVIYY